MTNPETTKHILIEELERICLEQKCHPTELSPYVRKMVRSEQRWKGQLPSHLVLETQRSLSVNHPQGWM